MGCDACKHGLESSIDFTMAFQPIIDAEQRSVWGYEALIRGPNGEVAQHVLDQVTDETRYAFDQCCRITAIELAARLFPPLNRPVLSINFLPNAVYEPAACIRVTLNAALKNRFPVDRIMLEVTESEKVEDPAHIQKIITHYKKRNLITAIDDFGAGYAGLGLLADFQPDLIKLDMHLIRGIEADAGRRTIVTAITMAAQQLGVTVLAEGVETEAELEVVRELGISLVQGHLFARPAVEALPEVNWSALDAPASAEKTA